MKKLYLLLLIPVLSGFSAYSQMFILNEDFSGTTGTTPPTGWSNVYISGTSTDIWQFDNPGQRAVNFPITEPFAIFDADSVSNNGTPESAALESPLFDASVSNYILLNFQHVFSQGSGATGKVEAFNGSAWQQIALFSSSTLNPASEILDLSSVIGGVTNARIRFVWSGNGNGWWAVDNIRIYASLPLDAGVVSLDNPLNPVAPGVHNVAITLGNFGYNTLNSSTINWTVDGAAQPAFPWTGNIGFGQILENVVIGSYNFQDPVMVKIWQTNPNGQPDPNPYNDTISVYIKTTLCGTYTIGGTDPDFTSFADAASVLNDAGVTCPVTFLVRNGIYKEQFILRNIPGASATNTVTFRSESGDSTAAILQIFPGALKYEPMVWMIGTQHVVFEELGLFTGSEVSYANPAIQMEGVRDVTVQNCYFEGKNQFDFGILAQGGSRQIDISHNRFRSISGRAGAIHVTGAGTREISIQNNSITGAFDWGYVTIRSGNGVKQLAVHDNQLENCYRAIYLVGNDSAVISHNMVTNSNDGIFVDDFCSAIQISSNRLLGIKSHPNVPEGTAAITLNEAGTAAVFNNFIQTTGLGPVMGISIIKSTGCAVHYNSINVTSTDQQKASKGLYVNTGNGINANNNIFNVRYGGTPVYITLSTGLNFNRNDYFNFEGDFGFFNGNFYSDLQQWQAATGMDAASQSVIPFFTSVTDLSINQALLNNAGSPVTGITTDIDGTPRNVTNPDLGAKEFTPCPVDAGINAVTSPQNPLGVGTAPVKVLLQNQGSQTLSSAQINWQVNGQPQAPFNWNGSLAAGANAEVQAGSYNFLAGEVYRITAWTTEPNGGADCNHLNDTITSRQLATPLCGTYTIGGTSPDFARVADAVNVLNLAGISCPVEFLIRNGIYEEQFTIGAIPGSSATNTVVFRSESGDSSQAVIKLPANAQKFAIMITLNGAQHVTFRELGLFTGSNVGFDNNAVILTGASGIEIDRCYFQLPRESDLGVGIQGQSHGVVIKDCYIDCIHARAMALNVADGGTRDVEFSGNRVLGATDNSFSTVRAGNDTRRINIHDNNLERCFQAIYIVGADTVDITGNIITNSNYGIYIDNFCSVVNIQSNRLSFINSLETVPEGTNAITIQNTAGADVVNNFIHTAGNGPGHGIKTLNVANGNIHYNSISITNSDPQGRSTGFILSGTNNQVFARNNIFNHLNPGIPVSILTPGQAVDLDRNDYFSVDGTIGYYNGRRFASLTVWADSLNMDVNSVSATPFFSSATDLSINQALLNNAGTPVPGVSTDIDGVPRDPAAPDIGAKEYNPCQADAGINRLISPSNPLSSGNLPVIVELQNQGTSALSSARINWEVNGQPQNAFNWAGNLGVAANSEVQIGEYDFQSGRLYEIRAWTTDPNSNTDCNHANDTAYGRNLAAPLCGTYTIGGNAPDFPTVSDAATVLNGAGIDCAVTFLVRDGIYYERITLEEIRGSSAENTITFRSESGDSSQAIIKIDPAALQGESLIHLKGTQHIRFDKLGLATGSTLSVANRAILLEGAGNVEIENCYFQVLKESDLGLDIIGASQDIIAIDNRIDCIDNKSGAVNVMDDGTRNIQVSGNSITGNVLRGNTLVRINSGTSHISLTGNTMANSYRAVFVNGADSVILSGNAINNTHDGIYAGGNGRSISITANRLTNIRSFQNMPEGTSGIIIQNFQLVDIINNFVHTTGSGPVLGINVREADSCRVIYNSVNVTNTDPQSKSKALYMTEVQQLSSRDNIFNIRTYGVPCHIDADVSGFVADYNNYYHPSGLIGKIESTSFNSLFEWGTAVNGDANAMNQNPYFKADTIPLPFQRALNGAGIPIPGIPDDIDGKIRFSQAPDVGCLEFTVDYGVLDLISPSLDCFHDDSDSIIVLLKMFGDVPFAELRVAYTLDNGPVHIDTIPGPVYGDIIHNFGTIEDISAEGEYFFKIWLIGTLDDNINNDTLNAWRYSKPSPVVTMDFDNFCTGWTVNFTGSATVVSPYTIESYEWLFGDGETSTGQNPVHTYLEPGNYNVTLRAYSSAGCYGALTQAIFIDPDFQGLAMSYTLVNETCYMSGTGSLDIQPSGGYPPYEIFVNGAKINSNQISNLTSGTYAVRIQDSQGCSVSDTIISISDIFMDPQISATPTSGLTPLTVEFSFTAIDPVSWTWFFPDGDVISPDTTSSPTFTFIDYGVHQVILEVEGGHPYYCTERDTVEIFVDVIVTIEVNTVFTPNNDGFNDYFEIKTSAVRELTCNIYNQWGNKVYQIDEVNGRWDGNNKGGAEMPDGTYFYAISAYGFDNRDHERSGAVLLLRNASQAYPNPVSGSVKVETAGVLEAPARFVVYSVEGQVALSGDVDDPLNVNIDLAPLPKGIYLLKVFDDKRHYYVRIIKN